VKKAGDPELHLVLTKPEQDAELRKAIKDHRIVTVFQESVGHHTDRGTVGFEPGINRQFLIFPKSVRSFEGKEIVGIKYDLLKVKEISKSQRATTPKPPRPKKEKSVQHREKVEAPEESRTEEQLRPKRNESVAAIKQKVRQAMKILEAGKAVAAFNLLKELVGEP
jgi:hypothetical protein